jgi:transcriptional regulator with XRE-family HTH domain
MAENLWSLREQKKVSVATLANRAGLPIGLIMEYESGQRGIDPRHLGRLARALYVDEGEIKMQSDPRPGAGHLERQPRPDRASYRGSGAPDRPSNAPPSPKTRERAPKPEPRPPAPARPSQISHLQTVMRQLNRTPAQLEAEIGKPLSELDRAEMSGLLRSLQDKARELTAERHRGYLPESVDTFEAKYLGGAQESGAVLRFTLFDGRTDEGQVIGFSPYSITIRALDGTERTLNKLALVSYTTRRPLDSGDPEDKP